MSTEPTSPRLFPCAWVSFAERMPAPQYDGSGGPTHGAILVTNNLAARDRWGAHSHVWLANMVHEHPNGPHVFNGRTLAEQGEITAFVEPNDRPVRGLTHWRPAVPEEWEYDAQGLPTRCNVSDSSAAPTKTNQGGRS